MLEPRPALPSTEVVGGYVRSAVRSTRLRQWVALGLGVLPAILFFFAYNQVRFGSPGESGYALATLPPFLERQRALGLFALAHIPMNLDYFLIHLPTFIPTFPFFKPDGLGMSVFITSPGLLFATQADWRRPRSWWLARRHDRGADPDPPLLRRRLAPVRLPLLPRFGAVRHRAVRSGRRPSRHDRDRLEGADRIRRWSSWPSASTGPTRSDAPTAHRDPGHLRAVGGGRPDRRDRLVAPAGPRLREHDAGGLGDPDRLLRRHRRRQLRGWPGRRPDPAIRCGCTASSSWRWPSSWS